MKKSKLLVSLLATTMVAGMTGCKKDPLENEDQQIVAVYKAYQANAEANGETPLSYEDWLKSVKGEKGDPGTPGKDGVSPTVTIGDNGNWFVNGVDTGKKAQGDKGDQGNPGNPGNDGATPVITIGDNGNWFVNGVDTGKTSKGADAVAPVVEVGINGNWFVNGVDTGAKAAGKDGADAIPPVIAIDANGYWTVNGVSMGVKAQGEKGDQGNPGDKGETGKSAYEIWKEYHPHYTGDEGQWSDDLGNGALAGFLRGHGDNASNIAIVEDDENVYMNATCAVCGAEYQYKVLKKVQAATYEIAGRSSYNWTYDEATGVYTSGNINVSQSGGSNSYMDVNILTDGVISFDYTSSGEGGYDYLYCLYNTSSESAAEFTCKGNGTDAHNVSGKFEKEVVAGDRITLVFHKDNSGNKGDDRGTVKFASPNPTYGYLEFDTNGGSQVNPMFLKDGQPVGAIEEPTCDRKYFEGWFVDENLTTPYLPGSAFDGNSKLYAKWSDGQFVTFVENGGSIVPPVMFRAGTTPEMPADPTRDGYVFLGWYTNEDLADEHKYVPGNANAGFNLFAKWFDMSLANAMYGHYSGVKQTGSSSPSTSYAEMDVDVLGNYKVREYYNGYLEGALGAFDANNYATTTNNGTVIFDNYRNIAVFVKATNIVGDTPVFVMNKDGDLTPSNVKAKAFKLGNTANGLRIITVGTGADKFNIVVDADTDKVIYNANVRNLEGNAVYADTMATNELQLIVTEPGTFAVTKYGLSASGTYTKLADGAFSGIFTNDDKGEIKFGGAGKAIWNGMSNGSLFDYEKVSDNVYYLSYSATYRYLVTVNPLDGTYTYEVRKVNALFDANYEGAPAAASYAVTYDYWTDFDEIPVVDPTRDGYTFNGWYTAPTDGTKKTRDSIKVETTYYAHWLKNITVSFMETDDTAVAGVAAKTAVEGSAIGELPVPTKEGKVFMGWFADKAFTTPVTAATVATAADIVAYAKWADPVTLTVNYGEASPKVIECTPGVAPTINGIEKEGYAIVGFFAEDTFATPVDLSNGITANTTVYVKYMELSAFSQAYVGYNLYSSTAGSTKTGNDILSQYRITVDENLACGMKGSGTITGYSNGVLTTTTSKAACAIAPDGTIFVVTHYSGFASSISLSSKDLMVCMSTGSEADSSVTMRGTLSGSVYTLVCTRGSKTYTLEIDCANNTVKLVSYVDVSI